MINKVKKWIEPEKAQIPESIAQFFPDHPFLAQALVTRGITDAKKASAFFVPDRYQPTPTDAFIEIPKAVNRITQAIRQGERIGIWGDFDVDGQTSTALLVSCLKSLDADVDFHIPVRATESHGINPKYLESYLKKGIQLLISCDTGISAHDAVLAAKAGGVDVIITDHHSLTGDIPPAYAVINPNLLPADHPFSALSGVGTAYQLGRALLESSGKAQLAETLIDLVALGTVADLATLNAENRYLVQKGLQLLRENKRKGLQELLALAATEPTQLTEEQIGFVIAPRMNAIGRLGDANDMVDFLLTNDETRAKKLALELEKLNFQRKMAVDNVYEGAIQLLQNNPEWMEHPILVLADSHWEAGVNGIVASRLVNQLMKPSLIITKQRDGTAHGSARSVAGVNIIQLISQQKDVLLKYGGHPMAAGFSLKSEFIDQFRNRINIAYQNVHGKMPLQHELKIDVILPLSSIHQNLADDIEKLAPFGPGNPRIILVSRHIQIVHSSAIGKNKEHLKIKVQDDSGASQELIWWQGEESLLPGGDIDLAYSLRARDFRGRQAVQLEWLDWQESSREEITVQAPSFEIHDFRHLSRDQLLAKCSKLQEFNLAVWAEGEEVVGMRTLNRAQLLKADTLIILTIPPAKDILQEALAMVNPSGLWLGGINPDMDYVVLFIKRLTGLLNHVIHEKNGVVELNAVAALTSQTISTVKIGTLLLAAQGHITIEDASERQFKIGKGGVKDIQIEQKLILNLEAVLKESAAFRRYYLSMNAQQLLS